MATIDKDYHKQDGTDIDITKTMKRVDNKLLNMTANINPVDAGVTGPVHPTLVDGDKSEPPVLEKVRYARMLTGQDPRIDTVIKDEDIEIIKRKAYITTLKDFDRWLIKEYLGDVTDLNKRAWLRDVYPKWFERQQEAMEKLNDVKRKYEIMKIEGPITLEDIYFMYMYEKDLSRYGGSLVNMSNKKVLGLMSEDEYRSAASETEAAATTTDKADKYYRKSFERGLFNSRKRTLDMAREMVLALSMGIPGDRVAEFPIAGPQYATPENVTTDEFKLNYPYRAASNNLDTIARHARKQAIDSVDRRNADTQRHLGSYNFNQL